MIFSMDVRRARKGDCLLIHYGSKNKPGLILIDGGPAQVYKPHLKPRLDEIRKARGLAAAASLPVDLLMVSHVDDDHMKGILELTGEMVDAFDAKKPLPLKISSVWHNTFDDVIGNDPQELTASLKRTFGTAAVGGEIDVEGLDPAAARILASIDQGFRLRDHARKLKLRVNPQFGGDLIMTMGKAKATDLGKGLKMTVAGPMKPELLKLQEAHDKFLKAKKEKEGEASLASFTDSSVPNLSSLVLLAEAGKKRMLLTGDARGDKILEGLELAGVLKKGGKIHVEILKMPHHGSDRNMEASFLSRVTADHYVFSGNGEHGNPERETLQMLLDANGDADFTIHLTYPIQEIDAARKADWNKKQKTKKKKTRWSPKTQSLSAFFDAHKKFAKKVSIVPRKGPYLINLLEKVTF
ncbi:MAG: hypothetical protein ACT4OT_10595 [Acidobacteriota bacterium]